MERSQRELAWVAGFLCAAGLALTVKLSVGLPVSAKATVAVLLAAALVAYAPTVSWRWVLVGLIAVILFIPIRVYTVKANLPFALEPYRFFVALILLGWVAALLADPRVRLRRTGLEGPLLVILFAALLSELANPGRVAGLEADVLKSLTFFASFILVLYFVASVIRELGAIDFVVRAFVVGGAVVSIFAVFESKTGFNVFNHLGRVLPFLELNGANVLDRGGQFRAFGSAEHPIALSAALVMLVPLAVYLARSSSRWWWLFALVLTLGALSTRSRTGLLMLAAICLVYLWLRSKETRRMWPLVLPILAVIHFSMPGTLGTFRASLFPAEGLIKQQESSAGSCMSAGRVADLRPSLEEAARKPLFGSGYGTRITQGEDANACILDDQWLGTLLEDGAVAVVGWLWLFLRFVRRMAAAARRDPTDRGWLIVGIAASVIAYAVGMLTFDAFSFIQVTFFLYIFLGLGVALLAAGQEPSPRLLRSAGR